MDSADRQPLDAGFLRELLVAPTGPLARLEIVDRSESTNTELAASVAADPDAWPAPALLVAEHQVAGRGRAGRVWETPARSALTCSLLVRPQVPREAMSWLPLLAGLATVTALRSTLGLHAAAKWPNDVLVEDAGPHVEGWGTARKVAGILTELLPDGGAIVGIGVNVSQTAEELPVESATSLALAGAATTDRVVILTALGEAFTSVLARWAGAGGDVVSSGLDEEIAAVSATVGSQVRVSLLDGSAVVGEATGHAPDGGLVVADAQGRTQTVHSGDVHHLRVG
ncbi:biotin--[acetyl-CoA-carboxylase] ligase [Sanguibacter sp. 25GB23B1]|uniref:biotin--[acetyl-CoA-carboxylase] ligase n=1 Tax=unclassified Sanguibacter TaxID=2645534 RepID=UPI0032AEA968